MSTEEFLARNAEVVCAPCQHCGVSPIEHQVEHKGLCCDCFDLSSGIPLRQLNAERRERGLPPVKPWPRGAGK